MATSNANVVWVLNHFNDQLALVVRSSYEASETVCRIMDWQFLTSGIAQHRIRIHSNDGEEKLIS